MYKNQIFVFCYSMQYNILGYVLLSVKCLYNYTGTSTGPDRISIVTSSQSGISTMDVDSIMRAFIGMHHCVSFCRPANPQAMRFLLEPRTYT